MNYRIIHRTLYEYSEPVTVSHHAARLKPRLTEVQHRADFSLDILPEPAVRTVRTDYFGNPVCFFSVQEIHQRLDITATSLVSLDRLTPTALGLSPDWKQVAALFREPATAETAEPYQFRFDSPLLRASPELADYARESFPDGAPLLLGVEDLNHRIHADFKYDQVATTVATPLEEVLKHRRGVCQDFAHLAIASLRSLGLLARYVSGYMRTTRRRAKSASPAPTPRTRGSPFSARASAGWISTPHQRSVTRRRTH